MSASKSRALFTVFCSIISNAPAVLFPDEQCDLIHTLTLPPRSCGARSSAMRLESERVQTAATSEEARGYGEGLRCRFCLPIAYQGVRMELCRSANTYSRQSGHDRGLQNVELISGRSGMAILIESTILYTYRQRKKKSHKIPIRHSSGYIRSQTLNTNEPPTSSTAQSSHVCPRKFLLLSALSTLCVITVVCQIPSWLPLSPSLPPPPATPLSSSLPRRS